MKKYISKRLEGLDPSLTPQQGIIFMVLSSGEMTLHELSQRSGRNPSTITGLVAKLVDKGYVSTTRSTEDQRTVYVELTKKGQDFIPEFDRISNDLYTTTYQGFEECEINREQFRRGLERMIANFEETNN